MPERFSWANAGSWPAFDGPGYVFLGRALLRVGGFLFPETWSNNDPFEAEGQERFRAARAEIRRHCAYGDLVAAQLGENGSYRPLKATIWNTSKFEGWFKYCQISNEDAYGMGSSTLYSWLFVESEGLKKITALASAAAATERQRQVNQSSYLSPYMELMFDVIRELSIDSEHQSKIDSIGDVIQREWMARGFPESEKMRSAMATLIRHPASQKGRRSNKN